MSRRGENIRRRKDGRWEARYPAGETDSGHKIYRSVYANTYRDVKEKRRCAVTAVQLPQTQKKEILFAEAAALWMSDNHVRVKGATEYRYRYLLETHILPELGSIQLSKVTSPMINAFLSNKLQRGRLDGNGGLSPAYVRSITLIIDAILRFAASQELCLPLRTKINKPHITPRELPVLSKEHQDKLEVLLCSETDETKLGILISLYAGLRIGEVCALTWGDVDLNNNILYVRNTVSRIGCEINGIMTTKLIIDAPKTASSIRSIPICTKLTQIMKQCRENAVSGYVVSTKEDFLSPRTLEYRFHRLLDESGIPRIHYHALRHTFATRCVEAGVDAKSLSEILGHASVSITLNTYVHSSMEQKRLQIEKLLL